MENRMRATACLGVRMSTVLVLVGLVTSGAFAQTHVVTTELRPTAPWTFKVSAGVANTAADGSLGGPLLQLGIERTLNDEWSLRIQNRTFRTNYDPAANPPVTSTTQVEFGGAFVRVVQPSALIHAYLGGGASFQVMSFTGVDAPHDKALSIMGIAGFELHPESRRWGAFIEVFVQGRKMPAELENGRVSVGQAGISFGASIPIHGPHRASAP